MELRRFLLITTAAVVGVLALLAWFYPTGDDFRTDNPFWNGLRNNSPAVTLDPLSSLSGLSSLPGGSTLIVVPYLEFTPAELDSLQRFVTRGGALVIADDYGHGNQVVSRLGIPARFSGQALLDPLLSYKSGWFPRIYRLSSSPLLANSNSLVFNHATALTDTASQDVLAWSSSLSFLDRNGNGVWDENEPSGPLPVISQQNIGDGRVILVSDPSVFINSMQGIEGNDMLLRNLASPTGSRLYIDQSHLPESSLQETKSVLNIIRDWCAKPLMTVGLVTIAVVASLLPVWYRRRKTMAR